MKFRSGSSHRRLRLAAAFLLILVLLIFFLLVFKKNTPTLKVVDTEIEGMNLTYLDFDKNNQKKMLIQCRQSKKTDDGRLHMKKIAATIFKTDKLDKDIQVTAETGIISNNFYNFDIRESARIFSSDFTLSSHNFTLENRELLSSREGVDFKLQSIDGKAAEGMEYFLNQNILKFFSCKGTWVRNGKSYDFKTSTFWVIKKSNMMVLQKSAELVGAGATVKGDWISLQFDKDFANLHEATVLGNGYFNAQETGEDGRSQSKEISADLIKMTYDPAGRLQQITVHGAGKIVLADIKNKSRIESNAVEIFLHSETQTLEKINVLTRGTLSHRGQDNIMVSGDSLSALYSPDGILAGIKAENNCEFSTDDFRGTAAAITYDAAHFLIDITGKDATILSKKNIFTSNNFLIHTKRRQLSSDEHVKATIMPEKKNVLLSKKPLFITSAGMEMTDRGNIVRFKEKVKLFQDGIELYAGGMLFDSRRNLISCQRNADLKFFNDNELLVLHGQTVLFNTPERKIVVSGDARLNQVENVLGGRQIELRFAPSNQLENVFARDNVTFAKKDLSGKSGLLYWYFNKKTILFKNSAEITRKDSGTTRGRELLLNLSSNEIKVSSQEDRAETIIKQG